MSSILIIGERLNSSNPSVRRILEERDEGTLLTIARDQLSGGAFAVDINASMLRDGEREALLWAARAIRSKLAAIVSLDSPNAELLLELAPEFGEQVILNSFTADPEQIERALPVMVRSGATAVFMLKDREGIPETAMLRLELASRVSGFVCRAGIPEERVLLDPIVTPVATTAGGLRVTLETIEALKRNFPNFRTIGGVSNVSFGLPQRRLVNRAFLAMAVSRGLDAAICDAADSELVATLKAVEAITGFDAGCRDFLSFHRSQKG
jgi:cobalamin-dependent methionine synthase I